MLVRNYVIPTTSTRLWEATLTEQQRQQWDYLRAQLPVERARVVAVNYQFLRFMMLEADSLVNSHADYARLLGLVEQVLTAPFSEVGKQGIVSFSVFYERVAWWASSEEEEYAVRALADVMADGGARGLRYARRVVEFVLPRFLQRLCEAVDLGLVDSMMRV